VNNDARSILHVGQQIIRRKWCSERDIVYHIVAPMLLCAGWSPAEMYFEKWENGSAPDISLIPQGMDHPVLTVEAKALTKDIGTFYKGWSRSVAVGQKRRDDVVLQVFQQLTSVGRQNGHRFALLTNGISFALFSSVEIGAQLYSIICLDVTTLSELSTEQSHFTFINNYLSRDVYCNDNCRALLMECGELHGQTSKTSKLESTAAEGASNASEAVTVSLPSDWQESIVRWCKEFRCSDLVLPLCSAEGIKDIVKLSFYESMRFCKSLQPLLPSGWYLDFKKGSGGNINIQLYPKWASEDLSSMKGAFVFQLTPNGKTLGVIWINASEDKKNQYERGTALWKFYDTKLSMKSKLPKNPKVYEKGMNELILTVIEDGIRSLREASLI
jgi:hypothetical protein